MIYFSTLEVFCILLKHFFVYHRQTIAMRRSIYFTIVLTALFAAAAFRKVQQEKAATTAAFQTINSKKLLSFRCSPEYIPEEDHLIPRLTGWGNYSWKITTSSDSAQFYFNQGINMYYAFHIIEARASFEKALHFDNGCGMAWWGKALAFGPNINDFGYQRPSQAYDAAINAMETSSNCTLIEKSLIEAIAVRYSPDSTIDQGELNKKYRQEMLKVYKNNRNNADVKALYADALMLLHPWDLYEHDFKPKQWTPEIVQVLQQALALNKKHPGANHYYIHAVEASAEPGAALPSALYLSTAMPDVSHITHMPSHIYIRTGFYDKGIQLNDNAVDGYKKYLKAFEPVAENIALYSIHNVHMKLSCAMMAGNYKEAMSASKNMKEQIPAFYLSMPGALGNFIQYVHESELFTLVRFGKWKEILEASVNDSLVFTSLLQHFARGVAFAKSNQLADAKNELIMLQQRIANPQLKEPFVPFNSAFDAALVGEKILQGVIAENEQNFKAAIAYYEQAVTAEDKLIYNEPKDWLLPARHYLGNALLLAKQNNAAAEVFKKDLFINPQNGWALTGLVQSLKNKTGSEAIASAQKRLKAAWIINDIKVEHAVF